jgi:1-aminocyclopropane-1-carboxylate deaminase/D-cysteine desulfhydrase-like pyridoxal-dependent ACC family enzyme
MLPPAPPTRIQEWPLPAARERNIRLLVKRDDEIHPHVSGNKWRKLKYNLLAARDAGFSALLTFGGAYSNHLAATAAAGQLLGWETLGFVRGEATDPLNPTLAFARSCGMELRYLDRTAYRTYSKGMGMEQWERDYFVLPEGGSNALALKGCAELAAECAEQLDAWPDYFCVAAGTGGTAAGLISGMPTSSHLLAFPVLKGDFMETAIRQLLEDSGYADNRNWQVIADYHFGGYARFTSQLITFINQTKAQFGIPLDPVYTGKLFFGVSDLLQKGFFQEGATVLLIHTGGLQGIAGFNQRFGDCIA